MIVIKKGSPSLKNYLNRGGLRGVAGWVHAHTNYEAVYANATKRHGYNSPAYYEAVAEAALVAMQGLKSPAHVEAVKAWEAERLARASE
jgi:hypothetical protein